MNDFGFHFSHGSLREMMERSVCFYPSSQTLPTILDPASIKISHRNPVLRIINIEGQLNVKEENDKAEQNFCCITVSDGVDELRCLLSKKKQYMTEKNHKNNYQQYLSIDNKVDDPRIHFLRPGSVIFLYQYSIVSAKGFTNEPLYQKKLNLDFPDVELIVNKFQIVGFCDLELLNITADVFSNISSSSNISESESQKTDNVATTKTHSTALSCVEMNASEYPLASTLTSDQSDVMSNFKSAKEFLNDQNLIKSNYKNPKIIDAKENAQKTRVSNVSLHTIAELNPNKFKNLNWRIIAMVTQIAPIRHFQNRITGQPGQVFRFQIRDKSGQIECVGFNQIINLMGLDELSVNRLYSIQNCEIKLSKGTCKGWPNDVSSNSELIFDHKSTISLIETGQDESDLQLVQNTSSENICQIQPIELKKENNIPKKTESVYRSALCLSSHLTLLSDLINKPARSLHDVIAVLINLDSELKTIKKSTELSLRNGTLLDKTGTQIGVAFWGLQAEHCEFAEGSVILFKDILLTNFGGISLSVIKPTRLIKVDSSHPIGSELLNWYLNVYQKN